MDTVSGDMGDWLSQSSAQWPFSEILDDSILRRGSSQPEGCSEEVLALEEKHRLGHPGPPVWGVDLEDSGGGLLGSGGEG